MERTARARGGTRDHAAIVSHGTATRTLIPGPAYKNEARGAPSNDDAITTFRPQEARDAHLLLRRRIAHSGRGARARSDRRDPGHGFADQPHDDGHADADDRDDRR